MLAACDDSTCPLATSEHTTVALSAQAYSHPVPVTSLSGWGRIGPLPSTSATWLSTTSHANRNKNYSLQHHHQPTALGQLPVRPYHGLRRHTARPPDHDQRLSHFKRTYPLATWLDTHFNPPRAAPLPGPRHPPQPFLPTCVPVWHPASKVAPMWSHIHTSFLTPIRQFSHAD